jgi:hypothetical protein
MLNPLGVWSLRSEASHCECEVMFTMQTNNQDNNPRSAGRITDQDNSLANGSGKIDFDYLSILEHQLRDLWAQYVGRLDRNGFDETAKVLKEKYFRLYRSYRNNKNWKDLVNN